MYMKVLANSQIRAIPFATMSMANDTSQYLVWSLIYSVRKVTLVMGDEFMMDDVMD